MSQTFPRKALTVSVVLFLWALVTPQQGLAQDRVSIVPRPVKVEVKRGHFILGSNTRVMIESESDAAVGVAVNLASKLRQVTGYALELERPEKRKYKDAILLRTSPGLAKLGNEGYRLSVTKDEVAIEAFAPAGLFYGVQSLYQLLPPEIERMAEVSGISWTVPCVRIEDMPRFSWRGVHLDVGRHFFSKDAVKKYLDYLAMYKMNTFHWHLTEDQGWRIEIKKYPRLTETGAWRKETTDDEVPYDGFYTQEDVREVVDYARERFITVVPEIEMPGHCLAALTSYPWLSCSGGPFQVATEWGIFYDVYCAGKDTTFEFLQDVLTEVIALFPGAYIHIGGDEVPKLRWQNCVHCQARIKAEGLANENELQSYFIKRIEKFLDSQGKRLVGWDEILEGGLAPNAVVMSWRGIIGGVEAAKSGHDVVMTPTDYCYFDYYQARYDEPKAIGGYLPLEKVYSYEPIPPELTPQEAGHILGAQANLWTEYMDNFSQVEYMLLPRMAALSEVVWSKKDQRDYQDFSRRIVPQYERLAAKEVNFRLPPPEGLGGRRIISSPVKVTVYPPFPQAEVHYTLDGSEPTWQSPRLPAQPIEIEGSAFLKARTILPSGRPSLVAKTAFSFIDPERNGLEYAYYEGSWFKLPDLTSLTPAKTGRVYDITLEPAGAREDNFALMFRGFLQIDAPGEYTFTAVADDGARIVIGSDEVVRKEGIFGRKQVSGKIMLEAGRYPLEITYFQKSGDRKLEVLCEGPGVEKQSLPPQWLFVR